MVNHPKVRGIRSDGLRSRETILNAAARLATVEGLDGLSIARLADHIGMSKSGLYAHFGSKEELQLATIDTAIAIFQADVIFPTDSIEDPLEKVEALALRFLDYVRRKVFPGGCFLPAFASEFDTQPGPVRQRLVDTYLGWMGLLQGLLGEAQAAGGIGADEDPAQIAFEVDSYLLMANQVFILCDDPVAIDRAAVAVRGSLNRARNA